MTKPTKPPPELRRPQAQLRRAPNQRRRSELERLLDLTVLGPTHPELGTCWRFTGSTTPYGRIAKAQDSYTHRLGWKLLRGPIPKGKELHHRCGVYACWNPRTNGTYVGRIANMATRCRVTICGSARTGYESVGRAMQRTSRRSGSANAAPDSLAPIPHSNRYVN